MKNNLNQIIFLLCYLVLSISFTACYPAINEQTVATDLRCEYLRSPLGIDVVSPRFTWMLHSELPDMKQKKYRVRVATSPEKIAADTPDMWDSGSVPEREALAEYQGKALQPHTRYYWDVQVWDDNGSLCQSSKVDYFETAKYAPADWSAQWITDEHDMSYEPAPLFRTPFKVEKNIASARAYVCGLGYYEMFINGQRVGQSCMDPGYTHFDKRVLYSTYDVTPLLKTGENVVGVVLGNGWFNEQSVAVWDFHKASWRKRPQLICEIRITYNDGEVKTIATNEQWKTNTGAVIFNNIYSGDRVDARKEEKGWNNTGFNDSKWTNARVTDPTAPILQSQLMPAIEIEEELSPVSMKTFGNNCYVFDMGKNITGGVRIGIQGEAGTRITIKHGEMLNKEGRVELGNINIYFKPIDTNETLQTDQYTLRGDKAGELFYPRFTYHGFQYVEIESSRPIKLTKENVTGLFYHTLVEPVGQFSCSNELLNKIWAATNLSYLGNLHSIPTDCPQREKNGWTADAHAAMDIALLNFDGIKVYEKWMNDFIDNQRPEGDVSGIIPSAGWGFGPWIGPVWDAAMFIIPQSLYNYYGDTRTIATIYPTCKRYLEYLKGKETENGLLNYGLGDWVPYKTQTPNDFTSSCFYYWDYKLMAQFATLQGEDPSQYQQKADTIKAAINRLYFKPEEAIYANGSQSALGVALYMELVPEEYAQKVADNLATSIRNHNGHLDFGLLGSKFVPTVLTRYGHVDLAYEMISKDTAPSWGAWIKGGATTLPETWLFSPNFADASLNHVFLGDVSAWMYNTLSGINLDPEQPGFTNILFKPHFLSSLDWAKGVHRSSKGIISSEWKRQTDGLVIYQISVPANSTASVYLPKEETEKPDGCRYNRKKACFEVGSGSYTFTIKQN